MSGTNRGDATPLDSKLYTAEASESRKQTDEELGVEDPDEQEGLERIAANELPQKRTSHE